MMKYFVIAWTLVFALPVLAQSTDPLPEPSYQGRQTYAAQGKAIDVKGGPVVDPSENVKSLNEANSKRQDDLRGGSERLTQSQLDSQEKMNAMRSDHVKELMSLRADYDSRLLVAEAKRIDAIRAVDVAAVAVDRVRVTDQALVLATQVSQSAEALRSLVANTATTQAASQQQVVNTLSARLTTLEQAGYQQAGQQKFQDPAFVSLLSKVEALSSARSTQEGNSKGQGDLIGWIFGGVALLIAAFTFMRNPTLHPRTPGT